MTNLFTNPYLADVISAATMLFFIMDPLGGIPVFLSVLQNFTPSERRKIIIRELVIALLILLAFLLTGVQLLSFLQLKQSSLSIAGGIILFIIAIRMVFPPGRRENNDLSDDEPFIVPLAMPLIAGPSAIASILLLVNSKPEQLMQWVVALLVAWTMTAVILLASPLILRLVRQKGLKAIERLMGMLLIMVSVQMFLDGIAAYMHG